MDWQDYYLLLERWVREQNENIENRYKNARAWLTEKHATTWANFMARQKFELEMKKNEKSTETSNHTETPAPGVNSRNNPIQSHRYKIPNPWRRIAAELIDSILMLVVKFILIYIIRNDSPLIELYRYFGWNLLSSAPEYRALRRAQFWTKAELTQNEHVFKKLERIFSISSESNFDSDSFLDLHLLLLIDYFGRFICATLEAILISHSFFGSGPGGATLGKWIMNLRVVSCDEVIPLPDMVEVIPGTDLGICRAVIRSIFKGTSFLTAFSFMCMLLFRYHRCTYDIIAGTLVVQPLPRRADNEGD